MRRLIGSVLVVSGFSLCVLSSVLHADEAVPGVIRACIEHGQGNQRIYVLDPNEACKGKDSPIELNARLGLRGETPNLVGRWTFAEGAAGSCGFDNIWLPWPRSQTSTSGPITWPTCGSFGPGFGLQVTKQEGRAFAGFFGVYPNYPDLSTFQPLTAPNPWGQSVLTKLTGALGEDGSVLMQGWNGNNRIFISGTVSGNGLEISGLANEFEDWKANVPSMGSFYFRGTKVVVP